MGYLGNNLQAAYSSYLLIDSLTASFNGTTTSFPLRVNGITPVPFPVNEQNVLISVGGVPQKPDPTGSEGFRFSGSNIVFSSAPKTGEAFWGVVLAGADYINVGADFPDGSASAPSITFASEKSTGFYKVSSGTIGVALNGSLGPLFTGSGVYLNNTNNGLYSPGTNQLALSTAGTGRLFVDASGNVGIGTSTPNTGGYGGSVLGVFGSSNNGGNIWLTSETTAAGNRTGRIGFGTEGNTVNKETARIWSLAEGTTAGNLGGNLLFNTKSDGGSLTERVRIDGSGNVGIGTASPGTSRTYIQCNDTNTAGLTISGINSSTGVSTFSTLKLIGSTPNNVTTHYGAEFIKVQSNVEGITGYYSDVTGAYQTQTNFHAKLTKNLAASTNGYCYYADLSTSFSGGAAYFHYCYNSTSTALRFSVQDSGQVVINSAASTAPFIAKINNTEVARIDSAGRLLVGTSTSRAVGTPVAYPGLFQIESTAYIPLSIANNSNDYQPSYFLLGKSRGTTAGSFTIVQNGDGLGYIGFAGADGTDLETRGAAISCEVDGAPGVNDMPGRLMFSTTADGSASPTERMRIDSAGRVGINTTSLSSIFSIVRDDSAFYYTPCIYAEIGGTAGSGGQFGTFKQRSGTFGDSLLTFDRARTDYFTGLAFATTGTTNWYFGVGGLPGVGGDSALQVRTSAGSPVLYLNTSNQLLVGTTTAAASGGVLQVSNGVTFPATQVACTNVNTLDDYEEGTWTPAIAGTSTAGTGTYSVQVGRYTKIGNTVTAHLNLTWSAHTGTGNMNISGLPFTSANVANLNPVTAAYATTLTITGVPTIVVTTNATIASINAVNNGTASALAMDTAAVIAATITYQTA